MIPIDDDKTKTVETSNVPTENNDISTTHEDIHVKVESLETSNKNVYYYDDMIYGNSKEVKHPWKMGKLITLLFCNNTPLIALGSEKLSLILTYEFFVNGSYAIIYFAAAKTINFYVTLFNTILYLALVFCHFTIILINPGIPPVSYHASEFMKTEQYQRLSQVKRKQFSYCEICHIICPPEKEIEHCEECNICVMKYDHHCFWTGKCITKRNIWAFYIFLFGTLTYIIVFFVTLIIWLCELSDRAGKKQL